MRSQGVLAVNCCRFNRRSSLPTGLVLKGSEPYLERWRHRLALPTLFDMSTTNTRGQPSTQAFPSRLPTRCEMSRRHKMTQSWSQPVLRPLSCEPRSRPREEESALGLGWQKAKRGGLRTTSIHFPLDFRLPYSSEINEVLLYSHSATKPT